MTEEVPMYRSTDGKMWYSREESDARDRRVDLDNLVERWVEEGNPRWPKAALRAKRAIIQFTLWREGLD